MQNISFVVIARNEACVLRKCLDSIVDLNLAHCEVICVDSASTDETSVIMREYASVHPYFRVLSVANCRNAAMARNCGKEMATEPLIFFVDGDIELDQHFVQAALQELEDPDISAVTGGLDEIMYDLSKKPIRGPYIRRRYSRKSKELCCGGAFIARREAVRETGNYDERFFVNEDNDYSLRLTAKFSMIALPMPMGVHHTSEYKHRPGLHLRNGVIFNQGMLARKHFRRPRFWRVWYPSRRGFVWGFMVVNLLLGLTCLCLFGLIGWAVPAVFTAMLMAFEVAYSISARQSLVSTLILHLLCPHAVFLGFLVEPFIGQPGKGDETGNEIS